MSKTVQLMEAVQTKWLADPSLPTLVPGGLRDERLSPLPGAPYASIVVTEGEKEENSSDIYLQPFTVLIRVWSANGSTVPKNVAGAMASCFDRQPLVVPTCRHLGTRLMPDGLEKDAATKKGEDVMIAVGQWEVWLQITRGV